MKTDKHIQSDAPKFFRWIIDHAKVEVLSGNNIEVHGMADNGMCPVISAEELYELFKKYPDGFTQPNQ